MPENTQRLTVRVYYEDTDFSGRVYHASYLRFLERGRTEWLRAFGLQHDDLAQTKGIAFAVTKLQIDFFAGSTIDDLLMVATSLHELRGPILTFQQIVTRATTTIASSLVDVVTIKNQRAARPPRELLAALAQLKRQ
ncbi:MAG: YbgC/FadM family acyl-CoA thioesterase [Pseudomonadota bacterium]|nr:YbgC/FadM family acyl-CoA thioesterase [Pseudomonadota bacterium]